MRAAWSCFVVVALLVSATARSQDANTPDKDTADKPYASIVVRNMFGLLPIPPPDTNPPAAPVDPPPKIVLNGIMTIFGKDQALFKVEVKQPKQGQPKELSYVLSEGERQDDIEVTKIDHENRLVTFNNHGAVQEVNLEDAGNGTPPAGGAGGGPGGGAAPGFRPGGPMSPADRIAMIRQRQAQRANTIAGSTFAGNANFNSASPPAATGMGINSSQSTYNQQPQQNIEDQVMSVATQMAEIEQNRIATQQAVSQGLMPPLPPTPMSPQDSIGGPDGSPLVAPTESLTPPPPPVRR